MSRDRVVVMERIRNEERWIFRNLQRAWLVAETVVLWNDGSTDKTQDEVRRALVSDSTSDEFSEMPLGWRGEAVGPEGRRSLHVLQSPFWASARPKERVSENRDKNFLWYYTKANVAADTVLALDGDEELSKEFVRRFPEVMAAFDANVDMIYVPFIYVWDADNQQRVDALYGSDHIGNTVFTKRLRFPRIFTVRRVSGDDLFDMHFSWAGGKAGFHGGSIPKEGFKRADGQLLGELIFTAPIVHWGYYDEPLRQAKYKFYTTNDPGNEFEGEYGHIIGQPDCLCPGPVELAPWSDD